jgi:hypothetical protein
MRGSSLICQISSINVHIIELDSIEVELAVTVEVQSPPALLDLTLLVLYPDFPLDSRPLSASKARPVVAFASTPSV